MSTLTTNKTSFTNLFKALLERKDFNWFGYQVSSDWKRVGCDGLITTFHTEYKGLKIKLSKWVYTRHQYRIKPTYPLEKPCTFISIEVKDLSARYGRRNPVSETCFDDSDLDWKIANELFDDIKSKTEMFHPGRSERISSILALKKITKILKS